ncbi:MAG: penicillin amidase [Frankiales bacterium]|nr:penicillin amidase [Frankiales bacterium]
MRRSLPPLLACLLLALAVPARADDAPPPQQLRAINALPPGESGFVSVPAQAQGMVSGKPSDYGPHIDDQRELFWSQHHKAGGFETPTGTPETPHDGVRIYRGAYGVPLVYGDTGADVWWGAGYAAGQDRLFLADAIRRLGRGTFGELGGPSYVPDDVRVRVGAYTDAEYQQMFDALPQESRDAIQAYSDGINAWISKVQLDPQLLPAEYAVLTSVPTSWTPIDSMAAGVYITRFVASAGLLEPEPLTLLRPLVQAYGHDEGLNAFADLSWQQDTKATTTIPASSGVFDNDAVPEGQRDVVFRSRADYALGLPADLDEGPGTGAYPVPASPSPVVAVSAAQAARDKVIGTAVERLHEWARSLRGGSFGFAVSPKRSATGGALLMSAPQLGYSYPSELWELEVHGGGYDARGVSVPSLPTVAIGYGKRVAWALTTGFSRTIDSFIETTRRSETGALEYLHDGTWLPADCRTETVKYRTSEDGVPIGPAVFSVDVPVCRTIHGPIVATSADGVHVRSAQFAMWKRELETADGMLGFDKAQNLTQFRAAVAKVTWNENVLYADADGHIAYWHPGLQPMRSPLADPRFPSPGTGGFDWKGLMPFDALPHALDPPVGYLANWNSKPSVGWVDTLGDPYSARPSGIATRVNNIRAELDTAPPLTLAGVEHVATGLGRRDVRWPFEKPLLSALPTAGLDDTTRAALAAVLAWDGTTLGAGAGTSAGAFTDETVTDGPGPTIFRLFADKLRDKLFTGLPAFAVTRSDALHLDNDSFATTSHIFDANPVDNLALRVLRPQLSSLTPQHDWLAGRTRDQVVKGALADTVAALTASYGADVSGWRGQHPRRPVDSLTGVVGPSLTMPYEDRGSWEHIVVLDAPETVAVRPPPAGGGGLATTGPTLVVPVAGLLVLLLAMTLRRRIVTFGERHRRRRC